MKAYFFSTILFCLMGFSGYAQGDYEGRLLAPDTLASWIANEQKNYILLNTGPVQDIKTAINIGAVEYQENLERLDKVADTLDPSKIIVVYCGCCPLVVCPNIEPAVQLLTAKKFKVFILNLPEALEDDWINKGYPLAAGSK